jgi:restriction system protein
MTIVEAIKEVLGASAEALTVDEIYNKIITAKLYGFKAAEPKSVVRSLLRRHCIGLSFATASPVKYFKLVNGERYAIESLEGVRAEKPLKTESISGRDKLPEETIGEAHEQHLAFTRNQLRQKILQSHFSFFEVLVIDLLIKMGYGGSDPKRGIHTGGPGDGGIDGIIYEDKLGLEKIHLQAKLYALDRAVGRREVQQFAGALNKVRKGIFITTSSFNKNARVFAESHEKAITLIDGDTLCDLMISHGVGIQTVERYSIYKVDNDYFSTGD